MSEEVRKFDCWKEVIKDYLDKLGDENKKEEYLQFLLSNFFHLKLNDAKGQEDDLTILKKDLIKINKIKITSNNKDKLEEYYLKFVNNGWIKDCSAEVVFITKKHCFYNIWICRAIVLGNEVFPATHIAKLTHSQSMATSFLDNSEIFKKSYLSTSSLLTKKIDGSYPDAKLSKNVKFLMLEHNGKLLSEELITRNSEVLSVFSDSNEELVLWIQNFHRLLTPTPASDSLAKQVFFPIKNNEYHLLTILKSSTLSQAIFDTCFEKLTRKKQSLLNKNKTNNSYSPDVYQQFISVAKISPVSSQPQNVSVLNGKRGGYIRLFSTQPPTWQSQLKAPIYKQSLFDYFGNSHITEDINYLREFLLRFEHIGLSIKDPKRYEHLERWVNSIIDEVLFYTSSLQTMPAGWSSSKDIKLKVEHQYFLDPYRDDKDFQNKREATDWQRVVSHDFARWLNQKLAGKDKQFTPQAEHTKLWKKIFVAPLREDTEAIKADAKYSQQKDKV